MTLSPLEVSFFLLPGFSFLGKKMSTFIKCLIRFFFLDFSPPSPFQQKLEHFLSILSKSCHIPIHPRFTPSTVFLFCCRVFFCCRVVLVQYCSGIKGNAVCNPTHSQPRLLSIYNAPTQQPTAYTKYRVKVRTVHYNNSMQTWRYSVFALLYCTTVVLLLLLLQLLLILLLHYGYVDDGGLHRCIDRCTT